MWTFPNKYLYAYIQDIYTFHEIRRNRIFLFLVIEEQTAAFGQTAFCSVLQKGGEMKHFVNWRIASSYPRCFRILIRKKKETHTRTMGLSSFCTHTDKVWRGFILFVLFQVDTSQCRCVWLCIYAWNKVKFVVCPF